MHENSTFLFYIGKSWNRGRCVGLLDYLFKNGPRNLIIDEIEYVPLDQTALLSLMKTGISSETKFDKTRKAVMKT